MTLYFPGYDEREYLRDELLAQDRAERRRLAPHWCPTCLGHTGPGSPCAPEEDESEEQESE